MGVWAFGFGYPAWRNNMVSKVRNHGILADIGENGGQDTNISFILRYGLKVLFSSRWCFAGA